MRRTRCFAVFFARSLSVGVVIEANTVRNPLTSAIFDGCFTCARCCLIVLDRLPFLGASLEEALPPALP